MSGTWTDPKRRLAMIMALIVLLLCTGLLVWHYKMQTTSVASSSSSDSAVVERKPEPPSSESSSPSSEPVLPPPRPVELAGLDRSTHGVRSKLTRNGSSGKVFFTTDELNYSIDRDYDQRAAVELENRSKEPVSVVGELIDLDHEVLGSFVGPGSSARPLPIGPGEKAVLALHLFARDATRAGYHPRIEIKDADRGEVLAWAPVNIVVRLPAFKLTVQAGQPDPHSLGLPFTITNDGGPLTDFAVRPGKNLAGNVTFQPSTNHANLASGASIHVTVQPRLHTAFTGLDGEVILSGAGQQQTVPVRFSLPPGQKVFVAGSFCTESRSAADWYCTNRPNVNTSIGGFIGGPISPWSSNSPYLPQGQVTWQWLSIGGVPLKTNFGPAPVGTYTPGGGAGGGRAPVKLPPLGLGGSGDPQPDVDPAVQALRDDDARMDSGGMQACNQFGGGDEPLAAYPPWGGSMHGTPRGQVSGPYAHHRKQVQEDNEPECAIAISRGEPDKRFLVQAWHTQRWCPEKREQIALRAWDGNGQRALTRPILLSDGNS